jgi:hypothetical protein
MRTAHSWFITQRVVKPETSIRNYYYPLRNDPEERSSNKPLKTEPIGCPETSIRNYHYLLRSDPEQRRSNEHVVTLAMKIFHSFFQSQNFFDSLFHQIRLKTTQQVVDKNSSFKFRVCKSVHRSWLRIGTGGGHLWVR